MMQIISQTIPRIEHAGLSDEKKHLFLFMTDRRGNPIRAAIPIELAQDLLGPVAQARVQVQKLAIY